MTFLTWPLGGSRGQMCLFLPRDGDALPLMHDSTLDLIFMCDSFLLLRAHQSHFVRSIIVSRAAEQENALPDVCWFSFI